MQSWCRTWPPNGSSRIRAKTKLHKKPREACKNSWNPRGIQKSFTLTIPWNSVKLVKISPGIIVRLQPHRSETNGIAERALRRVKEGTSAVLLQSGLDENWCADSMECYTHLRNMQDLLLDGKTPFERRFGKPLKGPIIPFGSLVEYHPISAKDQSKSHQFDKNVLPGLFLGYALYAGGIWKGDIFIGCRHWGVGSDGRRRIRNLLWKAQCKGSEKQQRKWKNYFPAADGRINLSGRDQELRTPTLIREHRIRGESHLDFLGEAEGSLPPPHDSFPDAGEAINDFWSMLGNFKNRHHVEPRVKLYSPREESFPIPLKYIDVSRTARTNFGC